jgi:ribosomal protein L7/L12
MAVAAGTLRRGQKQEQQQAAKAKRDKIILAVGGAVLVLVLAFEVPSLMSGSSSSAPPAPAESAAAPSTSAVPGAPTAAQVRSDLKEIAALPQKDPFQAQLGVVGAPTTNPTLAKPPHVRNTHFVLKNPFKVQVDAAQASAGASAPLAKAPHVTAAKPAHKAAGKSSSAPLGYIVILRSLDSKAAARKEVKKAHGQGLVSAAVLYSSKYATLRHGYWVVYLNKYPSMAAANSGLQQARAHGYASAYRRPVKK